MFKAIIQQIICVCIINECIQQPNSLYSIFAKITNSLLPTPLIGNPFVVIGEVDSSNNYAMRQVQADLAEHGTCYFATYQNKGKGQRGKPWKGEPGQNIMMSIVLEPTFLTIDNQFFLNIAIALACYEMFNSYTIDKTCIKWPNDIYWGDRKAGGILIENILQGKDWRFSIAGIGININQTVFPAELPNPVSLKQITGKTLDPVVLAKELAVYLEDKWQLLRQDNKDELLDQYNQILYKRNDTVTFKKDNAKFSAIVKGVAEDGQLIIDTGEVSKVPFGTVEWVLP